MDESGQFTKNNRRDYFVIASFTVDEPRKTAKSFRAWCRSHFPRKMRDLNEIKWSATGISDELRMKTLREISSFDIQIRFAYLNNQNIPLEYLRKNKLKSGLLYTSIVAEILDSYLPVKDKEIRIFCDRINLGTLSEGEFKEMLKTRLFSSLPKSTIIQIEMIDSTSSANIQIADWIVGALARYLEKGPLGEECYLILERNIVDKGTELFG